MSLRDYLKSRGMKASQLAKSAGMSRQSFHYHLSTQARGKDLPLSVTISCAEFLELSIEDFLDKLEELKEL